MSSQRAALSWIWSEWPNFISAGWGNLFLSFLRFLFVKLLFNFQNRLCSQWVLWGVQYFRAVFMILNKFFFYFWILIREKRSKLFICRLWNQNLACFHLGDWCVIVFFLFFFLDFFKNIAVKYRQLNRIFFPCLYAFIFMLCLIYFQNILQII